MNKYWRIGEPCVWGSGAALAFTLLVAATLIIVVMVNGLGVFWPSTLQQAELKDGSQLLGELTQREPAYEGEGFRRQYKIGNRDLYGLDFRWIDESQVIKTTAPEEATVLEREEYGNFYGYLKSVREDGKVVAEGEQAWEELQRRLAEKKAKGEKPR